MGARAAATGGNWTISPALLAGTAGAKATTGSYSLSGHASAQPVATTVATTGVFLTGGASQLGPGFQAATMALRIPPTLGDPADAAITSTAITWTWTPSAEAAGIPGLTYAVYGPAALLASGLTAAAFPQTGLGVNTASTVDVRAVTPEGFQSECWLELPSTVRCDALRTRYTRANVPGTPAVAGELARTRASVFGVTVTVPANGNPAGTRFAVESLAPAGYLDGAGGLAGTAAYLAQTTWPHRDLRTLQLYSYRARAINGDGKLTSTDSAIGYGFSPAPGGTQQAIAHVNAASGSDTSGTGSYESPYQTLQFAIDKLAPTASAGSPALVYAWQGTYKERVKLKSYVSLRGRHPVNTLIDGRGVGSASDPVVTLAAHSKLISVHLRGGGVGTADVAGAAGYDLGDLEIRNNIIEATKFEAADPAGQHGLRLNESASTAPGTSVLIANNTVVGHQGHGVYLRYPGTTSLRDNILASNGGAGLYFWIPAADRARGHLVALSNNQAFGNGTNVDGPAAGNTVVEDPQLDPKSFKPGSGSAVTRGAYAGDYGPVGDEGPTYLVWLLPGALGWFLALAAGVSLRFLSVRRRLLVT